MGNKLNKLQILAVSVLLVLLAFLVASLVCALIYLIFHLLSLCFSTQVVAIIMVSIFVFLGLTYIAYIYLYNAEVRWIYRNKDE